MEAAVASALLFRKQIVEKRHTARTIKRRKDRVKRLQSFAAKQARQRMFAIMLSSAFTFTVMKPSKVLWSKERSGVWWEETVLKTFADKDWNENFRMSHSTYLLV